jgi:acetamidase/formamidase
MTRLDFDHVNPVSGPVFVRELDRDVLAVELLEFRPRTGAGRR